MRWKRLALTVGLLAVMAAPASADPVYNTYVTSAGDLISSRTGGSGITGFNAYEDFSVSWKIEQLPGGDWSYTYKFWDSGTDNQIRNISHVILELSQGAKYDEFTPNFVEKDLTTYKPNIPNSSSNPGLPGDIYGIKVAGASDPGSPTLALVFTTWRAPVWGNFYVKDGNDGPHYAYNTGFADLTSDKTLNFIARPDGGSVPVVPEPSSLAVAGVGGIALMLLAARRRKAQLG